MFAAAPACEPGYSQCSRFGECLPRRWFCDGVVDCNDGSDENNCPDLRTSPCWAYMTECATQKLTSDPPCYWNDWWCDGTSDCTDKSDEQGCSGELLVVCRCIYIYIYIYALVFIRLFY